ncbi:DUF559 domain-containing protein [bacterium]|nr:MAG: DUF559 domain-containing protein [bacterium]
MRMWARDHSEASRERSRELRRERSVSEKVLWEFLRKDRLGYRFRTQVRVGPYFLDFYCASAALCIEVDGEQHESRSYRDARRDAFLLQQGIRTIRIPSLDLFEKSGKALSGWIDLIQRECDIRNLSPQPPLQDEPLGEGEPD